MPRAEVGLSFRAQSEPAALQAIVTTVSRFDFDTLSVYDDLGDPPPFRTLEALAATKGNARVGPACLAVPRYRSLESATAEIAALARLRPGGVFLGLAPGAWMEALGLKPAGVEQMHEALSVCRYLLQDRTDGFEGRTYRVERGWRPSYSLPSLPVPLMLGAWGQRMLALGGELADEVKVGGGCAPGIAALVRGRLLPGLRRAARNDDEVRVVVGAVSVVDEDGDSARLAAKRRAVTYIPVVGGRDPVARENFGAELARIGDAMSRRDVDAAVEALPDELLARFAFAGTPGQVIRQAEALYEAGAERIEFGAPHGLEEARGVELFGRRVLPYFR